MSSSQAIYSRAEERRAVHFPGLHTLDCNGCELGRIIVLFMVAELEMNISVSPWAELTALCDMFNFYCVAKNTPHRC